MSSPELRQKFLKFFEERGHAIIPSASLVPLDDPTTLFTGSGMQPLVPYLLGKPHPKGRRLANSQKSFRAQDIEAVGDNRHTTFFEMLGNWSLGDYFKREQLKWFFEFLTKEIGLDVARLYVTCFRGNEALGIPRDEESAAIWQELFQKQDTDAEIVDFAERDGMRGGRIFYYDEKENWWSRFGAPQEMPPSDEPGGPDSEAFWDFGEHLGFHGQSPRKNMSCHVNCDCGRFVEIGNSVFMEYKKTARGFEKLEQRNVDFGGGLERMVAARNDDSDIFNVDLFDRLRTELEILSGKKYGEDQAVTRAFRIISDHMRASVFLIADGLRPSNIERGYILRRLLRRAARYALILELETGWYKPVVSAATETYRDTYPELDNVEEIQSVIGEELRKFEKVLERGLKEFQKLSSAGKISGAQTFDLYQSYGFPIEMVEELTAEKGISIDRKGFEEEFQKHQEISRAGLDQKFGGHGLAGVSDEDARKHPDIWKMTRLHTATHLMHQALREVLGSAVKQMGSDINIERTRFDFTFSRKVTDEELKRIEGIVNQKISEDLPVKREVTSYAEAIKSGALAFFKEKYPDTVSVYSIGSYSRELCGGPHVSRTGEIGKFKILKEESVSAGARRIRASVD